MPYCAYSDILKFGPNYSVSTPYTLNNPSGHVSLLRRRLHPLNFLMRFQSIPPLTTPHVILRSTFHVYAIGRTDRWSKKGSGQEVTERTRMTWLGGVRDVRNGGRRPSGATNVSVGRSLDLWCSEAASCPTRVGRDVAESDQVAITSVLCELSQIIFYCKLKLTPGPVIPDHVHLVKWH